MMPHVKNIIIMAQRERDVVLLQNCGDIQLVESWSKWS